MDLHEKIRTIPTLPGCYLYKNAEGEVIYVARRRTCAPVCAPTLWRAPAKTPRPEAC
jgi:hypothetical protein